MEVRLIAHLGLPALLAILAIFMLILGVGELPQTGKAPGWTLLRVTDRGLATSPASCMAAIAEPMGRHGGAASVAL